jgi:hypothetical protein
VGFIIDTSDAQPNRALPVISRATASEYWYAEAATCVLRLLPCCVLEVSFHPIQGFQQSETACPASVDFCSDGFISKDSGNSRLLSRLLTQMERIIEVNALTRGDQSSRGGGSAEYFYLTIPDRIFSNDRGLIIHD